MVFLSKPSRVHDQRQQGEFVLNPTSSTTTDHELGQQWSSLTVWRKSLVFNCEGFTVIDCKGKLVYRVDNYIGSHPDEEMVLMDGSGKPVFTMRRRNKKLILGNNWLIFQGEVGKCSSKEPICFVRKLVKILQPGKVNVLAQVYRKTCNTKCAFVIEGSYANRLCRVLDESRKVVAEIKRKEEIKCGVSFGKEVFVLIVQSGLDPGLAMAIVVLLDQMFS